LGETVDWIQWFVNSLRSPQSATCHALRAGSFSSIGNTHTGGLPLLPLLLLLLLLHVVLLAKPLVVLQQAF